MLHRIRLGFRNASAMAILAIGEKVLTGMSGNPAFADPPVRMEILEQARQGAEKQFRQYGTTTAELRAMSEWLKQSECTHGAMESTGVYWKHSQHTTTPEDVGVGQYQAGVGG